VAFSPIITCCRGTTGRRSNLTPERIRLTEGFIPEFRKQPIETKGVDELMEVDTFLVGHHKSVGRGCTCNRCSTANSRYSWGRPYTTKRLLNAVYVFNEDMLPFLERHLIPIKTILRDNGR
jgi:hypothetical protein